MNAAPALLIAGTHSGCGKTTLTLAVMAALKERDLTIHPFKCGPDFIDPTLHEMVTGRISRNLDIRMCGESFVRDCFSRHNPPAGAGQRSCAVVEGVMGLFDGGQGSAAHLAKILGLPVILVVDVRSAAESVAAVVKGFAVLDPELDLAGVICNRVGSARHAELIRTALAPQGIPLLGFLPREEEIAIPSRHLGLHMGEEAPLHQAALTALAQLAENHLDIPLLLQLAQRYAPPASPSGHAAAMPCRITGPKPRIGLARDAAFCFYYADNLDMLRAAGAELVPFSPLADNTLPKDLHGLYLGGGYPELHAHTLAANAGMRAAIRRFSEAGRPVYAECGGFMYLCRSLRDLDGGEHPMCTVFPLTCTMNPALRQLGYRRIRQVRATFFGPEELALFGHEFHYSSLLPPPEEDQAPSIARVWRSDQGQEEGYHCNNTLAGYIHLHWGQSPGVPAAFVQACRSSAS